MDKLRVKNSEKARLRRACAFLGFTPRSPAGLSPRKPGKALPASSSSRGDVPILKRAGSSVSLSKACPQDELFHPHPSRPRGGKDQLGSLCHAMRMGEPPSSALPKDCDRVPRPQDARPAPTPPRHVLWAPVGKQTLGLQELQGSDAV